MDAAPNVVTALSTDPVPARATGEVLADLLERGVQRPALAVVVTTPSFGGAVEDIRGAIDEVLAPLTMICVVSAGLVAGGIEVVDRPALAVWTIDRVDGAVVSVDPSGSRRRVIGSGVARRGAALTLVAGDPAIAVDAVVQDLDAALPDHDLAGGVLSSAAGPSRLIDPDGSEVDALAVAIDDALASTIWGASPIDQVRFAEVVDGSMVVRLDESPALDSVIRSIDALPESERAAVARNLRMALLGPDEFGVVPVLGTDRSTGAIAIGGSVSDGSLLQLLRADADGHLDSIIRTLVPLASPCLLATTGLDIPSAQESAPVALVSEICRGAAVGPVVAAVVAIVGGRTTLVDAAAAVVTPHVAAE